MKPSTLEQVREFHEAFGHPVGSVPGVIDPQTAALRVALLREETDELAAAIDARDLAGVLDALTDLQYVLDGAFLAFGLHLLKNDAFDLVHKSNMSKLGADGRPIYRPEDGKIMKGPNYRPPDLAGLLAAYIGAGL